MKDLINTAVKIIQKDAPYKSEGKWGIIVDYDYAFGGADMWYLVRFGEPNGDKPYESYFRREHLEFQENEGE